MSKLSPDQWRSLSSHLDEALEMRMQPRGATLLHIGLNGDPRPIWQQTSVALRIRYSVARSDDLLRSRVRVQSRMCG